MGSSKLSRLNLSSRNNSSLASRSSLNSLLELPSPHRGDPRWSTRCLTPAVSSPKTSLLHRTTGTVSTSPILPSCDSIYLLVTNIFHTGHAIHHLAETINVQIKAGSQLHFRAASN